MKILYPEQMRAIDEKSVELGASVLQLMENSAIQIARVVTDAAPEGEIALFCGRGNNGGDALAAARLLHEAGRSVRVVVLAPGDSVLSDAAKQNARRLMEMHVDMHFIDSDETLEQAEILCRDASLIVDALFGTGLSRAPEGFFYSAINYINAHHAPKLCVDVPSGINSETGEVPGAAVRGDMTLCLHLPKVGQLLYPGRSYCGTIQVADIGIDAELTPEDAPEMLWHSDVQALLPVRNENAHKGDFGHCVIFGGSRGMAGAGELAARACMRAGAGKTTIACAQGLVNVYMTKLTEVMVQPLPDDGQGMLGRAAVSMLSTLLSDKDAVAIGPGWGRGMDLSAVIQAILAQTHAPAVIDADGIIALSKLPDYRRKLPAGTILTPHPGEMARLTSIDLAEIIRNPIKHCRDLARRTGSVVLLKGGCTVVAAPDGRTTLNATGNSGMATAGSGDVLTGIIGALLAQGLSGYDAARVGAFVHGRAGDLAAQKRGRMGLIASDLVEFLPEVWLELGR